MAEFLSTYGLWILLVGIFVAMHAFGMGCCGRGRRHPEGRGTQPADPASTPDGTRAAMDTLPRRRVDRCH